MLNVPDASARLPGRHYYQWEYENLVLRSPLEMESNLGVAHAAMAYVYGARHDWAAADRECQQALGLDSKDASIYYFYAYNVLIPQVRYDEAVREMRRALELGPASLAINGNYGGTLMFARRYPEAKAQLDTALAMEPNFFLTHARMREWFEIRGRFEEARQAAIINRPEFSKMKVQPNKNEYWHGALEIEQQRMETLGETLTERIFSAIAYAQLGDHENAMKWLQKCDANEDDLLPNYMRSPLFDPLHGDPHYDALLRKLNLVP